jgi:hypothetical protein
MSGKSPPPIGFSGIGDIFPGVHAPSNSAQHNTMLTAKHKNFLFRFIPCPRFFFYVYPQSF